MSGANSKSGYKARYVSGFTPAAPTTDANRPQGSVYSIAGVGFGLLEAGMWESNGGPHRSTLRRLTTAGTPGAGQVEAKLDDNVGAAKCTAFTTHSAAPTLGDILYVYNTPNAAAIGMLMGWHDHPIECPPGTANGIGFISNALALGAVDVTFMWEE